MLTIETAYTTCYKWSAACLLSTYKW